MFAQIITSLLFTPYLIRSLGQSEYGVYSLVASITGYFSLLDLGVGNAIIKYMAKFRVQNDKSSQRKFLGLTLIYYFFVFLIIITIGLFLGNYLSVIFNKGLNAAELVKARIMFFLTIANIAVTMLFSGYQKTILAFERFKFSKTNDLVFLLIRIIVSTIVLYMGFKGTGVLCVNLCCTIIYSFVAIHYVHFHIKILPTFKNFDWLLVKEIVGYSTIILVQMIATQLNSMVDQILIGIFIKSSATILAVYAVGAQIVQYYQSIAGGINGILMPGVVKLVENNATTVNIQREMERIGRLLFIVLGVVWSVFLVNGKEFIYLWAGAVNGEAYYVAIIIMLPTMFYLVQSIGTQLLWAMNRHKIQATIQISVALFNVFLTYILIHWNPILGATIATALAVLFGDVFALNYVYYKYIGISIKEYYYNLFKGILKYLLMSIIVGKLILCIPIKNDIVLFFISSVLMVIVFLGFYLKFGATEFERNIFKNILKKIK